MSQGQFQFDERFTESKRKMTDIVDDLQFKYELNRALKHGWTFDQLFTQPGFATRFAEFQKSKIGKIWLKSAEGWDFRVWQGQ